LFYNENLRKKIHHNKHKAARLAKSFQFLFRCLWHEVLTGKWTAFVLLLFRLHIMAVVFLFFPQQNCHRNRKKSLRKHIWIVSVNIVMFRLLFKCISIIILTNSRRPSWTLTRRSKPSVSWRGWCLKTHRSAVDPERRFECRTAEALRPPEKPKWPKLHNRSQTSGNCRKCYTQSAAMINTSSYQQTKHLKMDVIEHCISSLLFLHII